MHHPIRTSRSDAQRLFDQGLTQDYGFNRDAARRSFAAAYAIDPDAAMTRAGLALALGPNLNMESSPMQIEAACDASQAALKLSRQDDERGYANALVSRFCGADGRGRLNSTAYVDAMSALHHELPLDPDAATLYADSLLELRPRTVRQDSEVVSVLEAVMRRHPDHVGANHYYIHAVEGTSSPERGLPSAKRLETLVPGVGHLLHMPSHIYMRTGEYEASIALNRQAAAVDLAYLRANPPGHDGAMYYLHDLESLAVAAGFAGQFAEAAPLRWRLRVSKPNWLASGRAVTFRRPLRWFSCASTNRRRSQRFRFRLRAMAPRRFSRIFHGLSHLRPWPTRQGSRRERRVRTRRADDS